MKNLISLLLLNFTTILLAFSQENKIYTLVDEMPIVINDSCAKLSTHKEKVNYSQMVLMSHIQKNIIYPAVAKEKGIEGRMILEFIIDKTGAIKDINILKSAHVLLEESAINAVKSLNDIKWKAGRENGRDVNVKLMIPINYKLNIHHNKVNDHLPRIITDSCESLETIELKQNCSQITLQHYIYQNLEYPADVKKEGIEGRVAIKFTVDSKGEINNIKILKSPDQSLSDAAITVVQKLNELEWIPAFNNENPVDFEYTIPILFKMHSDNTPENKK